MWFHDRGVYEMPTAGEVTEPLSLPLLSPHLLEEGGHLADQAGAGALHLTAVPVGQEEVAQQGRVCERLHDAVHEARVPQVDEAAQTWRRRAGSAGIRTPPAHGPTRVRRMEPLSKACTPLIGKGPRSADPQHSAPNFSINHSAKIA